MNKITKWILGAAACISLVPVLQNNTIQAEAKEDYGYYPMGCSAYEVDTVNGSGTFDMVGCYNSFDSAKQVMKQSGDDAVVRHNGSYSPTKIIAMNGGIAYSYPGRSGNGTLTVRSYYFSGASTYMMPGRQLYYMDTMSYDGSGSGTVRVEVTGFEGTVNLKDLDLIPFRYPENDIPVWCSGNNPYTGEAPFRAVQNQSFYQVEQHGNYKDLVFYGYSHRGTFVFYSAVGPAADWMNVGDVYYSSDDVNFYRDSYHRNLAGTYYNYYQFAPLRTKSSIPADKYNGYLARKGKNSSSKLWDTGQIFIDDQNYYGMNAAMVFAEAANESAYGTSGYALNRNNLFGVNAYDSNPNLAGYFSSVRSSIDYQMGVLLRDYMNDDDWRYYGSSFGNKGTGITVKYASDIYYGATLASIYYDFDKYANNYDGNLTDMNAVSFGIVNTADTSVYAKPDTNSTVCYNFLNGSGYQEDVSVAIIGEEGDFYKIQSQDYLNSNGSRAGLTGRNTAQWNWDTNVGYIRKSDVDVMSIHDLPESSSEQATVPEPTAAPEASVEPEPSAAPLPSSTPEPAAAPSPSSASESYSDPAPSSDPKETEDPDEEDDSNYESEYHSPEASNKNTVVMQKADTIAYKEGTDNTVLHIEGSAFIIGMNADDSTEITHDVVLVDMDNKKEYAIKADTSDTEGYSLYDGFTYKKIGYAADVNLADLPGENYYIEIRVTNGDAQGERGLMTNRISALEDTEVNGKDMRIYPSSMFSNRFEISSENNGIDRSLIHKPTDRFSSRSVKNLSIDDGVLSFNGYGIIYNASMNEADDPQYSIILSDQNGKTYSYDAKTKESSADYQTVMGLKNGADHADYSFRKDLSELPAGTYTMYIDIKTNEYEDIDELYSYRTQNIRDVVKDGRTYHIDTTGVRYRYQLTISE